MAEYFLLIFDLTNRNSFDAIPEWIALLKEYVEKPKFMIIGNKSDLEKNKIPDDEINDALEDKEQFKINDENFIKVSAKTGENIKEAFKYLLDIVEQNSDENKDEEIIIHQLV